MMSSDYIVILFYKFVAIADPDKLKEEQLELAKRLNLTGRVIIATEGINATLEGKIKDIAEYKKELVQDKRFSDIIFKDSEGTGGAFPKLKVKTRPEIVTLGAGVFDVKKETAPEVTAEELEKMYAEEEDFVVLDLRNDYEVATGYFKNTVNPELNNFRDLNQKIEALKDLKNKKVVAVCTGGIRCEKATCLLKRQGFSDIYQFKDGIHTYMEKYPARNFKGTLFVFDNRMVTSVVEAPQREVVGVCVFCRSMTEKYANDDSVTPSKKILCCDECFKMNKDRLREPVALKS